MVLWLFAFVALPALYLALVCVAARTSAFAFFVACAVAVIVLWWELIFVQSSFGTISACLRLQHAEACRLLHLAHSAVPARAEEHCDGGATQPPAAPQQVADQSHTEMLRQLVLDVSELKADTATRSAGEANGWSAVHRGLKARRRETRRCSTTPGPESEVELALPRCRSLPHL
jgi:hypothetical protein